jgi:hypothetical protein
MKKILVALLSMSISCYAFAEHVFKVCYVNKSESSVHYINDGISHKWKSRGELIGNGKLAVGETKCFANIKDETIFSSDMITFTINNKWFGIVNPGFARPYVISQDATEKKGGKLVAIKSEFKDSYPLYVFIMNNGIFILRTSENADDDSSIIYPRRFST